MIARLTLAAVCQSLPGLTEAELMRWIDAEWVRPVRRQGEPVFTEGDVARIRLILDLRGTLEVEEGTLPLVLSLVDQLYATRWQLRRVIELAGPNVAEKLFAEETDLTQPAAGP